MMGAIGVPITYFHFVSNFLKLKKRLILYFGYGLSSLFLLLNLTNYFVQGVESKLGFAFWPKPGVFFTPFLIFFFIYSAYATFLLTKRYVASSGNSRNQIRYILFGFIIGFLGGSTNYFLWFDIPILPIANILVTAFPLGIFYAIIRYRLLDVRIIFRKSTVFVIISGFAYSAFYFFLYIFNYLFGSAYNAKAFVLGVPFAFIFSFLFLKFEDLTKKLASRYFFGELYSRQEALRDFAEKLTTIVELKKLSPALLKNLIHSMHIDRAAFYLVYEKKLELEEAVGFLPPKIVLPNDLGKYLLDTGLAVVQEELELMVRDSRSKKERILLRKVSADMKEIKASVALPLILKNRLRGMIILGDKLSRDAYTKEDIDLLELLAKQAAVGLENARFYSEMESQVKERTREVEVANKRLAKLLRAKSEFLDIASHQLRTPVSIIRGMLSMLAEGSVKKTERESFIQDAYTTSDRLNAIINDLLNAAELDTRELKLNLSLTDLNELINDSLEMFEKMAEKKNLALKFSTNPNVKVINIDRERFRSAIDNLVDNAIKYTRQGGIEVGLEQNSSETTLRVKDTGIGFKAEDQKKVFQKFMRTEEAKGMEPSGSGLGLFIVKRIIDAHQGKIEVESPGLNQGSAFIVRLPNGIK